jgi:2-phosphosulfolactate phosphatase
MHKKIIIDCFPESARQYGRGHVIVAIDVIRASTSIVTALGTGRRCFPVPTLEAARIVAARLFKPILAGEIAGKVPSGFEMNNSPYELARRTDTARAVILLSSSGTRLIHESRNTDAVYIGCLRNLTSLTEYLAARYPRIALIGAGSRNEFREEDQLACAWFAKKFLALGYEPASSRTHEVIDAWGAKRLDSIQQGKSADYLRQSDQSRDLTFILHHVDDVQDVSMVKGDEVISIPFRRPNLADLKKAPARPAAFRPVYSLN